MHGGFQTVEHEGFVHELGVRGEDFGDLLYWDV